MEHILHLLFLLLLARAIGELAERLGQPASMGEIMAGVMIALVLALGVPSPFLAELAGSPFLEIAADFGIFFLLLLAGIEMRPGEIAKNGSSLIAVALGGVLVPLAAGFVLAWAVLPESQFKFAQALLVGVALSISAVPVAVRIFMELDMLHTRVGQTVVAAAILDDVIGLILLAVVTAVIATGTVPGVNAMLILLGRAALFFGIAIAVGQFVYPLFARFLQKLRIPAPNFSGLIVLALSLSVLAEALGMDFILGPFMAGLFFDPKVLGEQPFAQVKSSIADLTDGLLAPLFFLSIGIRVDLGAVIAVPAFLAALLAAAFFGKLIGAGGPARLAGMPTREALAVGVGMSGRGAVELVIASVALEAGLFDQPDPIVSNLFSALVIMAVVTTLVTPAGLRRLLAVKPASP